MLVRFTCPHCESHVAADETAAGACFVCPRCQARLLVPHRGVETGKLLGEFRVEAKIGSGGMGEVWRAFQESMDRRVALKILPPALTRDGDFVERFRREVRLLAQLDHPNIVTAISAGVEGDIHYLATAYVDGDNLEEVLKRQGKIPEAEALRIAQAVASALRHAWERHQLLHRDIKPSNIMLTRQGDVRLLDFGIGKSLKDDVAVTRSEAFVGTPNYMSPELASDAARVDSRADIYSLGVTLHHLLTGAVPFDATSVMGVLAKVLKEPLPPPRALEGSVSEACSRLVEGMTAPDRDRRYADWAGVLRDIARVRHGQMPQGPAIAIPRPGDGRLKKPHPVRAVHRGPGGHATAPPRRGALRRAVPAVTVVSVILSLAAVGIAVAVVRRNRAAPPPAKTAIARERMAPTPDSPATSSVAAADFPATPAAQRPARESPEEREQRELWEYAAAFARDNPEDFDRATEHFDRVAQRLAGTKYELMAAEEIQRLRKAKDDGVTAVLARLRDEAAPALRTNDFGAASTLYRTYKGPLWRESTGPRLREAMRLDEQGKAFTADQAKKASDTALLVVATTRQAAAHLAEGRPEAAWKTCRAFLDEPGRVGDVSAAVEFAAVLGGPSVGDAQVLDALKDLRGRDLSLSLNGGPRRPLRIAEVDGGMIRASFAGGDAGSLGFTPSDLSLADKYALLKDRPDAKATAALIQSLGMAQAGRFDPAAAAAGELPPCFGALATEMKTRRQSQREDEAAAECRRLFVAAGFKPASLDNDAVLRALPSDRASVPRLQMLQTALQRFLKDFDGTTFARDRVRLPAAIDHLIAQGLSASPLRGDRSSAARFTATNFDAVDKRVQDARSHTGLVVRCRAGGGGDYYDIDIALAALKPGTILRLAPGEHDRAKPIVIQADNVVVEGEGRLSCVLKIHARGCVLRNLHGPAGRAAGVTVDIGEASDGLCIVDSAIFRINHSLWCDGPVICNSVVRSCSVGRSYGRDIRNSTLIASGLLCERRFDLRDSIVWSPDSAPFHAPMAILSQVAFTVRDSVFAGLRGIACLSDGEKRTYLASLDDPGCFIKAENCLVAKPVFRDFDKGDLRLADGSPGKGAGPDGQDWGAQMNEDGLPVPPGCTRPPSFLPDQK